MKKMTVNINKIGVTFIAFIMLYNNINTVKWEKWWERLHNYIHY